MNRRRILRDDSDACSTSFARISSLLQTFLVGLTFVLGVVFTAGHGWASSAQIPHGPGMEAPRPGGPAWEGGPGRPGGFGQELPQFEGTGFIQGVAPGMIRMVSPEGQAWTLHLMPTTKVEVLGAATKEFLRPGELVRFIARVELRKSVVEEPVQSILVFTVNYSNADTQLGVFPESSIQGGESELRPDAREGSRTPQTSGQRGRQVKPPVSGRGAEQNLPQSMVLDIRGRLTGFTRQGKAVVALPPNIYVRGPIEVELAETVEVRVDITDPRAYLMASEGDRIRAKGFLVGPGMARPTEVIIEKTTPLGAKSPGTFEGKKELPERTRSLAREPSRAAKPAVTPHADATKEIRAPAVSQEDAADRSAEAEEEAEVTSSASDHMLGPLETDAAEGEKEN